ncbi:putative phosphatidylserine decarboxylase [Emericellopsis atlantica]|uniref:Phosphatidylserine decarboxylase proenzyme 2 n=1 Tax=Emericellopsis atlantica TaxID=2614577 RepID=A0A9P8CM10_9HYPO|nr:putative phosphatidylserine decarboxylase [Emericellopsis atlantica]KAG9250201.1 putative phosphatidylserine decarboxylase [Emericellopsis atlantica]
MRSNRDSTSPARDTGNGLVLKVDILKGRNLAAKDRNGSSDPYLVLTLGDRRAVTHTVPKSLNPEWNVVEELPLTSINSLLLDVVCWDKDRFGKDYMGEFDLALEDIFHNGHTAKDAKWYPLKSKRPGKKTGLVSGEILLQFTLLDTSNPAATPAQIFDKFYALVNSVPINATDSSAAVTPSRTPVLSPTIPRSTPAPAGTALSNNGAIDDDEDEDDDDDDDDVDDETSDEVDDPSKPDNAEKRRRRLRVKGLRRRKRRGAYAFTNGEQDVVGVLYLEIVKITDLPPESNLTRTSFDMDPFVVASLGRQTFKTKRVRHNLNPVFNDKMVFHVQGHETTYQLAFTVIDHDKYSGNDFIASCSLPIQEIIEQAPEANPETGLYELRDPAEYSRTASSGTKRRLKKFGMSRSSSTQSLTKLIRPGLNKSTSAASGISQVSAVDQAAGATALGAAPTSAPAPEPAAETPGEAEGDDFASVTIPLQLKNLEKWEAKHNPAIYLRAKYMPYPALRQQFWRALLRQYDTDDSGRISRVEMMTMLDTLGSTLTESTIDSFFQRFPHKAADNEDTWELTMDEAVLCLEDQLNAKSKPPTVGEKLKQIVPDMKNLQLPDGETTSASGTSTPAASGISQGAVPEITKVVSDEGDLTLDNDPAENGEEHVIEIKECPICHQPRLNKRSDADIITHIATCASQDWRQVNTVLMNGFVTASQAQRKWYSKVITKLSYGGYKLGANSANILVQDRLTGQINEEKMSVYVRMGIRMLYKGLKSRDMENKSIRRVLKNLSIKQGRKFDDPASRDEIEKFIHFHRLDTSEVLLGLDEFKNFNEFFYRALKPGARPCSAPDNPKIIVSPADCRSVVFNQINQATKIWVKGREFSIKRLLGKAYPEDVQRYDGGAMGIFRLAPQDYHRFHIPVDGIMGEPKTIEGEYYTVNPMAIRSALDVYGENVRILVPVDSPVFGRVMIICVGAMMVGSTVITRKEGEEVKRAEELGYFKFGGSTLLVLFEPGKMKFDDDLVDNSNGALETLVSARMHWRILLWIRVGMSIGHSPDEPQHTPDMRKNDQEITEEEKRMAARRIQGSVATGDSPDDSGEDASRPKRKLGKAPTMNTLAASAM